MTSDYDPFDPADRRDPYPTYRALRDTAPVHRAPRSDTWCVSRYEDALGVLRDPATFSSRAMFTVLMNGGKEGFPPLSWDMLKFLIRFPLRIRANPFSFPKVRNLIAEDPPRHGPLRNVVNRGFTPRRIAEWEPRIRALAEQHLDALRRGAPFDLVHDFAIPLPVTIIAEMLGVEPERKEDFKRWSDAFIEGATGTGRAHPFAPEFTDAVLDFMSYLRDVVRRRRRAPGDDLVSAILAESPGGEALSDLEVMMFVQLLLVAGNETTTNLIGNAVNALLDHPEQLARVHRDPGLVPALVEEVLRFDSPVQTVFRTATRDVEVAGVAIPSGGLVAVMIGSANRDERRFPDADAFDVARDPRGHLAFGFGEHFCLGSALARLEARVALEALVPELARVERSSPDRELVDSFLVRGPKRMPLIRAAA
jgi:cytochrome P450